MEVREERKRKVKKGKEMKGKGEKEICTREERREGRKQMNRLLNKEDTF